MFKTFITSLGIVLMLSIAAVPSAAQAISSYSDSFVFIAEDEVIDDNVIIFSDNADILGTIQGDLIVASSVANIKGTVTGDVIAAGSDISISGNVGGDVRVVSGSLIIDNIIGGNLTVASGKVSLSDTSEIGHSVLAATGLFEGEGAVVKHITAATGNMTLNGPIGGNVTATIDPEGSLLLLSESRVGGDISYTSSKELSRAPGAEVAGVIRRADIHPSANTDFPFRELFFIFKLISFLSILVIGLLLINVFPKATNAIAETIIKEPIKLPLLGFAYTFLTPIVIVLIAITIIGIPLAGLLFVLYMSAIYIAKLYAGIALGKVLISRTTTSEVSLFFALILGILLVYVISIIPYFGWVGSAIIMWWGLAGIVQWWYTQYRLNQ